MLPIDNQTNNWFSELIGLFHALKTIQDKHNTFTDTIIIMSDSRSGVDAIRGTIKPNNCNILISKCWEILQTLSNIPIIYWIPREHNAKADAVSKLAAELSKSYQNNPQTIDPNIPLITNNVSHQGIADINQQLLNQWSREWTQTDPNFCNQLLLKPDKSIRIILENLSNPRRKLIARLISGHVRLNENMFNYKISNTNKCIHCENSENIAHVLLYCNHYNQIRIDLFRNINNIYFSFNELNILPLEFDYSLDSQSRKFELMRILLTGNSNANISQRSEQVNCTCTFLEATERQF